MSGALYSLVISLHGALAVLACAVAVHPLVTLRRRAGLSRGTVLSADIAAILLVLAYAIGWWIYPDYRSSVKPDLMAHHLDVAMRFETKEHLALMAAALGVGGTLCLRLAGRAQAGRTAAFWLLAASVTCTLTVCGLGMFVRSVAQPGW